MVQNRVYYPFVIYYLVIASYALYLVTSHWADNRLNDYMFIFFVIISVFMFFFKRKFRKMTEQRNKDLNKK